MTAPARTAGLGAALAALIAADAWVHRPPPAPEVSVLPSFRPEDVTDLTVHHLDDEVHLVRQDDGWQVVAPYQAPADPDRVAAALDGLGSGVALGAVVDTANYETYGLAGADPIRVDASGPAGTLTSVVIGFNAGGGDSFVRLPERETVWRARVGGRSRYDVPAAGWRDHRMLTFAPDELAFLAVTRPEGPFTFAREHLADGRVGGWKLQGDDAFTVDPVLMPAIVRALAELRAVDVVSADTPSGLDAPVASVRLGLTNGLTHDLSLGRSGDAAFAALDGRPEVYRISPVLAQRLAAPRAAWEDHSLVAIDPDSVTRLALDQPGSPRVVLERSADGGWEVVEPTGVQADPRRAAQAAAFLAQLRVEEWLSVDPGAAGFAGGRRVVVYAGSSAVTVEIGGPVAGHPDQAYVRNAHRPERIGALPAQVIGAVVAAFGR